MKNKILAVLILSTIILTGCAKYERDESFDTDLYGTYSNNLEGANNQYSLTEEYEINKNDTYHHICDETINGETTKDWDDTGDILSVNKISDDIIEIVTNPEIYYKYKYKNMLGWFYEVEVPNGKTFDLKVDEYTWFDKDGQYHLCDGSDNCDCSDSYPKYIRKDDIIYFQSIDEEHKDCYTIAMYIVDDGLFSPEVYKEK